jgi:hypothetical protein
VAAQPGPEASRRAAAAPKAPPLIERGDFPLPLFQINARWRVPRKAVEALIEGAMAQAPPPG